MKKTALYFFTCICIIFLMPGCSSGKKITGGKLTAGPAAADIVNYVNQGIIALSELEQKALERYASVTGENATTDRRLYEALRDFVIPTYKRFVQGLNDISPENAEVRQVHNIFISGAESTLEGFQAIMIGSKTGDNTVIKQGNKKLEEGRIKTEQWKNALQELYKKHGVASVENK